MGTLTLRRADLGLGAPLDVRISGGVVTAVAADLKPDAGDSFDCAGAAVLPGLHDHHLHLLATAVAAESVSCGPPTVSSRSDLARVLRSATPRDGWIRAVGYDDGTLGLLDRAALDRMRSDVPIRLQHRGGALWVVNSAGLRALHITDVEPAGLERDAAGRPTGRLWRLDGWLAARLGERRAPDLRGLSARLASYGVTGVTDATPDLSAATARLLSGGQIAQRVTLLGDPDGSAAWKIVVADHELPDLGQLCAQVRAVRPRPVALHCVTLTALVLALTALREAGVSRGDRIEHAAVCPADVAAQLAALRVTVVTQPSLIALRGDDYLERTEPAEVPALWPFASLLSAGVPVGCSSDAPYGALDPWQTIAAAASRTAPSGRTVGAAERVRPEVALARFLTSPADPGGPARRVRPATAADLIVLDRPLAGALREPDLVRVQRTLIGGRVVHALEAVPA